MMNEDQRKENCNSKKWRISNEKKKITPLTGILYVNDEGNQKGLGNKLFFWMKRMVLKGIEYKVIVAKGEERYVTLPLLLVILAFALGFYFMMICLGMIFINKCEVMLVKK